MTPVIRVWIAGVICFLCTRLQEQEVLVAMGTDSSQRAVSNLDFEPRKKREFQKSSRGVGAEAPTPPAQRPKSLALSG
jgi:hypothetical protein